MFARNIQISFVLSFCLLLLSFSISKKEVIQYDINRQLTWNDYKGQPNRASTFKALTATSIKFNANSDGKTLSLSLINSFEPRASWTKTTENRNLLNHERLHFDISELYARELRKEILEMKVNSSGQKLIDKISKMYSTKMKELDDFQKQYDKETDHSIIESRQQAWEKDIKYKLDKLDAYQTTEVVIVLKH